MPKRALSNAGIVAGIFLILSFFYVYQRIQILRLGYDIRTAEKNLSKLNEENAGLQLKKSELISPKRIAEEVKKLGLDLIPPKEKQIVRVK